MNRMRSAKANLRSGGCEDFECPVCHLKMTRFVSADARGIRIPNDEGNLFVTNCLKCKTELVLIFSESQQDELFEEERKRYAQVNEAADDRG